MSIKLCPPFRNASPINVTQGFTLGVHEAIDISSSFGTPLVAPFRGQIARITQTEGLNGKTGELEHGCGLLMTSVEDPTYRVVYWHCQSVFPVSVGDIVEQGQIVAFMGNTGYVVGNGMIYTVAEREKEYMESTPTNLPKKGVHVHISMGIGDGTADNTKNVPITDYIDWNMPIRYDLFTAIKVVLQKITNMIKK